MIVFFQGIQVFAVMTEIPLQEEDIRKLSWLFGKAERITTPFVPGKFIGPRKEMVTPWSTNAVEITQNMGIHGIIRIEEFTSFDSRKGHHDKMLEQVYEGMGQQVFYIDHKPDPVIFIEDLPAYNKSEGLALSGEEIVYLEGLQLKLGRKLTDSEVFGFSQVNSEHCRHKIFNGIFVINGKEMPDTLFGLIRKTSKEHPRLLVSAYKDNVAFIEGPIIEQFAPETQDKPDYFLLKTFLL
jgi:phosphoribosylformylglycinamidine synthase